MQHVADISDNAVNTVINSLIARVLMPWVIDSGAASHVFYNQSMFLPMRPAINIIVILPTKEQFVVEHISTVCLADDVILFDVLYVSRCAYMFLSISTLLKDPRYPVNFSGTACVIHDTLPRR